MSKMKSFNDLAAPILADPARLANVERERSEALAEIAEHNLSELRRAMDITQVALAEQLGCGQPEVSRVENGEDPRLSTLREFVEGIGGHLETYAVFGDTRVRLRIGDNAGVPAENPTPLNVVPKRGVVSRTRSRAMSQSSERNSGRSVHMAERTGKKAAAAAGKTLGSKGASKAAKSSAASALAQTKSSKVTGSRAASAAGKTLASKTATKAAKRAAASALTQKATKRKRGK